VTYRVLREGVVEMDWELDASHALPGVQKPGLMK
jgi:hypothetical protein